MPSASALCLALTAAQPDLSAARAALSAGADPNAPCSVEKKYIGYHFERGEGLVSLLIPFYGLGKLIFGGEVVSEMVDVPPLTLAVEARSPELVRALAGAGVAFDQTSLEAAIDDALGWGRSDVIAALAEGGAALEPALNGERGLALLGVPGAWDALLRAGVPVDLRHGISPLEQAVLEGDTAAVSALLALGASPDGNPEDSGGAPLVDAVARGDLALAKLLVAAGAHLAPDIDRVLSVAAERGDLEAARWALDLGARPDTTVSWEPPLLAASKGGNPELVRLLLERGAPVDQLGSFERTPLEAASAGGHLGAMVALIEAGAEVGHQGFFRTTPLSLAASAGEPEAVALLIGAGAPTSWEGGNALGSAIDSGDAHTIALVRSFGGDIDTPDDDGWSGLDRAVIGGDEAAARQLIGDGAQLGLTATHRHTALHAAAAEGSVEGVDLALKLGVPLEAPDGYSGASPFLWAVQRCQDDAVEALLSRGADPRAVSRGGQGAGHAAVRCWNGSIFKILTSKHIPLDEIDNQGRSALHAAVLERPWALDDLLAAGLPVDVQDHQGQTALSLAMGLDSMIDAEYAVGRLVRAGARADLRDAEGRTALDVAVARRELSLVRLALEAPHAAPPTPYAFDDDTFQWNFNDADVIQLLLLHAGLPVELEGGADTAAGAGKLELAVALAEAGAPVGEGSLVAALAAGDLRSADALAARASLTPESWSRVRRQARRAGASTDAMAWVEERAR